MRRLYLTLALATLCSSFVPADTAIDQGKQTYETAGGYGCSVCHGIVAHGAGQVGGSIRGAGYDLLVKSLNENEVMQPLKPALNDTELHNISTYLVSLGEQPLIQLSYDNNQWFMTHEPLELGKPAQLVIYNASFDTQELDLTTLGLDRITIDPLSTEVKAWQATRSSIVIPNVLPLIEVSTETP